MFAGLREVWHVYGHACNYGGGGGPTPFLYMATRFLPNVHVQKCTKMYKICFFLFGSSLDRLLAVANLQ